jgi:uncharacterized protein YukE
MIIAGDPGGGGPGSAAFPAAPQGSPGGIAAAARALSQAGDELDHTEAGLHGASSMLASDWQGYAAAAYHASSSGLASVARAGAETFRECAQAVSGYGRVLDHAQSEIRRLRVLYDDAKGRQAAASGLAGRLEGALLGATKQSDVTRLDTQVKTATGQGQDAGHEADGYALQASRVLSEFRAAEARYTAVLSGDRPGSPGTPFASPFSGAGSPGPGFGVPFNTFGPLGTGSFVPAGLNAYNGVIPVGNPWSSPIPGYGVYLDATTPEAVPTDDLTDAILFIAPLFAGPAGDLGASALRQLAADLGIGAAGRAAVTDAGQEAIDRALADAFSSGATRYTRLSQIIRGALNEGNLARAEAEIEQGETRAAISDLALKIADAKDLLPSGVSDILSELAERGWVYKGYAIAKLVTVRDALLRLGTPAGRSAARALDGILNTIG